MTMFTRALGAAMLALTPSASQAQTPADFYKGKTVDLQIAYSVGGGYDLYARLVCPAPGQAHPGQSQGRAAQHAGRRRHAAANWLQSAAPKDGTVIGAVSRAMAFEPLLGNKAAKYDPTKITYIGSANDEVSVCMAWHTSGITTLRRRAAERARGRRRRHRRRHLSVPRASQQHVRRQVQDGHRLCRRHTRSTSPWSAAKCAGAAAFRGPR